LNEAQDDEQPTNLAEGEWSAVDLAPLARTNRRHCNTNDRPGRYIYCLQSSNNARIKIIYPRGQTVERMQMQKAGNKISWDGPEETSGRIALGVGGLLTQNASTEPLDSSQQNIERLTRGPKVVIRRARRERGPMLRLPDFHGVLCNYWTIRAGLGFLGISRTSHVPWHWEVIWKFERVLGVGKICFFLVGTVRGTIRTGHIFITASEYSAQTGAYGHIITVTRI